MLKQETAFYFYGSFFKLSFCLINSAPDFENRTTNMILIKITLFYLFLNDIVFFKQYLTYNKNIT